MEGWSGAGGRSILSCVGVGDDDDGRHGESLVVERQPLAQDAMPGSQMSRTIGIGGRCAIATVVVDALGMVRINKARTAVITIVVNNAT